MIEGRCRDRGTFPRTCLSGSWLSFQHSRKAKSTLMPTFHRREEKLAAPLGSQVSGCCPGVQALTFKRIFAVAPFDMLAVEVANMQTGV